MHYATRRSAITGSLVHMQRTRIIRPGQLPVATPCPRDQWTSCRCPVYCGAMASERADGRTPNRVFRLDTETWEAFERSCESKGISRSDAIRQFIKADVAAYEREQRRIARESAATGES